MSYKRELTVKRLGSVIPAAWRQELRWTVDDHQNELLPFPEDHKELRKARLRLESACRHIRMEIFRRRRHKPLWGPDFKISGKVAKPEL